MTHDGAMSPKKHLKLTKINLEACDAKSIPSIVHQINRWINLFGNHH
jgi:hypothetical protein